mgnify:CR=1 FL=1
MRSMAALAVITLGACSRNSEPAASENSAAPASIQAGTPAPESAAVPAASGLKVAISLSPAVAKLAAPNDVVFIFARAVQGSHMPLAIVRKQVKDLPTTVILDDSVSMSPQMKLSNVPEVIVVARVSKSGTAGAQAGDLEGRSVPVKPNRQAIDISIANVVTGK